MRGSTVAWVAAAWALGLCGGHVRGAAGEERQERQEGQETQDARRTAISIEHVFSPAGEMFRAVVRRQRAVTAGEAKSVVLELPHKADFSSVLVRGRTRDGTEVVLEQRVRPALKEPDAILESFVGEEIIVNRRLPPAADKARAPVETIQATLVALDAKVLVLRTKNPQLPLLIIPRSEEITEIKLRGNGHEVAASPAVVAELSGDVQELSCWYRVSEMQWRGQYRAIVDEAGGAVEVMGNVELFNDSGEAHGEADVTIGMQAGQQSIFEMKLPKPVALTKGWTRAGLFQLRRPQGQRVYLIDWNTREGGHEALVIRNRKESGLGMPLPPGTLEVLRQRDLMPMGDAVRLAGAGVGKDLIVPLSAAQGIDRVRRVRSSALAETEGTWRNRDEIEMTLKSTRAEETAVRVIDSISRRPFRIGSGSAAHELLGEGRIAFDVKVPAGGERTIHYAVDYPQR